MLAFEIATFGLRTQLSYPLGDGAIINARNKGAKISH